MLFSIQLHERQLTCFICTLQGDRTLARTSNQKSAVNWRLLKNKIVQSIIALNLQRKQYSSSLLFVLQMWCCRICLL